MVLIYICKPDQRADKVEKGIKSGSGSSSGILVSFVLTQTALMSFSEPGEHNFSDGLVGVVFGGLVVLVGLLSAEITE